MNFGMITAAALLVGVSAVHASFGPKVLRPIQLSDLPRATKAVVEVIWHGVTAIFIAFAIAAVWMAYYPNPALLWIVVGVQLAFAGLFIILGLTRLKTVKRLPQWGVFFLISGLMVWVA